MSCHTATLRSLQEQGMRLTAQRAMILEDLHHVRGHRTAEAIYSSVSTRLPGLNRATVYRTLEMLRAARVVAAFEAADGITEYELIVAEACHHHLVCRHCGTEFVLPAAPIEQLRAAIRQNSGFEADLDHLIVGGLCAACAGSAAGVQDASASAPQPGAAS